MSFIHVIIPVYNTERYLRETVDSVLSQPCKDIDIVLVDDGSTDGSGALCDQLAADESRISVIHKKNAGVSSARNTGIEYVLRGGDASGEYIAFLDSDDLWNKNVFTQEMVERLRTEEKTEMFGFGSCTCNGTASAFSAPALYADCTAPGGNGVIWKFQQYHFCANLYHVRLLQKYGIRFLEGLKYSEDKIFMLQCAFLAEQVHFMPQLLHIYRKNPSGAIGNQRNLSAQDFFLPIIDGWLKCDEFLNELSAHTGCTSDAGQTLAALYLVEMVEEHMKRWGSFSEIMSVFRNHPYYHAAESGERVRHNRKAYSNNRLLFVHPMRFRIKYRLIGAVEWVLRGLLHIPFVVELRERRRYPFTEIPK